MRSSRINIVIWWNCTECARNGVFMLYFERSSQTLWRIPTIGCWGNGSNDRTGAIQALLKLHLLLSNFEKSGTPIGKSVDNAVLLNQKSISIFNKSSRTTCTNPLINHFHLLIVDWSLAKHCHYRSDTLQKDQIEETQIAWDWGYPLRNKNREASKRRWNPWRKVATHRTFLWSIRVR